MVDEIERVYTIPLVRAFKTARAKRTAAAIKAIRSFLARHMKTDESRVKLSSELNSYIWMGGIKPPKKIRVKAKRDSKGEVYATIQKEKEEKKVS